MQVKIFESTDMASGLKLVKEALGPDALILSTRTIHNGKLGILGKPTLEITAAVDTPWPAARPRYQTLALTAPHPRKRHFSQWADSEDRPKAQSRGEKGLTYDSLFRLQQEPEEAPPKQPPKAGSAREGHPEMLGELDELKEMVKKLGQEMSRLSTAQQHESPADQPLSAASGEQKQVKVQTPESQQDQKDNKGQLLAMLMEQGVSETTAEEISASMEHRLLPSDEPGDNPMALKVLLQDTIRDLLQVAPPDFSETKTQHRIALVGPTGVGKTTTLAKIAAFYLTNFSSSIALITIDTYRIAAVEQLKVYGTIMNLPVEVVISPEQLEQALLRHGDKELILIDTAGRSPRDTLCIEELAGFLRADLAIDKHLVLSATTRRSELFEAIQRFGLLGIDSTIITKTDECATLGVMLDIQMADRDQTIPFSYITNGQRVPEDLLIATRKIVTELIMPPLQGTTHEHQ
ncbi:MAG: flagellar biosynthesis protein FlhF [Desulfoarculaceae bacterium]|nr:flagellar biosynthesis protein FlhF [Desulfoarculaceae bacterium]